MKIDGKFLEKLAFFYSNTDRQQLETVGLIQAGPSGNTRWKRFNHNFDIFILKLSDDEQQKLAEMINRYMSGGR